MSLRASIWCGILLVASGAALSCGPCTSSTPTELPCLGSDGGVFVFAYSEVAPACAVGLDGSVATFSYTSTVCPKLLGESFFLPIPCDVSGIPPGTYTASDGVGGVTFSVPLGPDAGLTQCGF